MPVKYASKATIVAMSLISTPALAQMLDAGQTYVAVQGGITQPEKHDFVASTGAKVTTELKDGYVVVGAIGRKFANTRLEIEGSYRENKVESHKTTGPALAGSEGKAQVTAGMLNAYYDMPTGGSITPYIGGGVGAADVKFEDYKTTALGTVLNDGETVFAYQGIAGASVALNSRVSLNAEYRYFGTADVGVKNGAQSSETEYKTHNFLVGAKYAF